MECKCSPNSWGYMEKLDICETPEFDDLTGTCFNCYHERKCHKEYWEEFGYLHYGEQDNEQR